MSRATQAIPANSENTSDVNLLFYEDPLRLLVKMISAQHSSNNGKN